MPIDPLLAFLPAPIATGLSHVPNMIAFDFGRYLIAATVIAAIVWIAKRTGWAYRQIQDRVARSEDYRREFLASLRTCAIFVFTGIFIVAGDEIGIFYDIEGSYGLGIDFALFAAIIVGHDAYFYWTHRMMHHPRLFRTFHRFHHRSITPTPFAAYAFSVPEALVMNAFMPLWLLFVPTPVTVISAFLAFMIVRNAMGHAGLELHARWWLKSPLTRWINTTTHHDLHHSGNFNRNYGLYFTWWDRLMGTEHPNYAAEFAKSVTKPIGLSESARPAATPAR
ncbi:sterol desaturase family protein [Parasphingopyxis algicola]|uniref:sterol desaturase family protein n=1 Tax=Parasphingopyxis algicola TaxID=2026624 RepID=UPI0015A19E4C|nr:sterol desaturase family protein [Parasphingopyxis algicola]QLC23642.1 sterol desaturase family protein [Parasphingopyxis algicola]